MRARGLLPVGVALAAACALALAAVPAAGKEGVTARLVGRLPRDAGPGETVTVAWALAGPDEGGRRRPFNAIGVFVRLVSAGGGRATIGFATPDAHPDGRYDARVAVPSGGIGGVQIGLRGENDAGASDVLFPLENDPFAAPAGQARSGGRRPGWPVPVGAAVLVLGAGVGLAGFRRWRSGRWRPRRGSSGGPAWPGGGTASSP
jgi:hypothetical protein